MEGTITWYRRGDPNAPNPQGGVEYLFWFEEEEGPGHAAVVEHIPRHWPGDSTHWAYINVPAET